MMFMWWEDECFEWAYLLKYCLEQRDASNAVLIVGIS